ncbi:MAG: hypothetical protein CMO26_20750 [Thiotrichales bacterium]|nr:hypothetical protein [Thiotrichales bacterium]|tara:strand:- start:285 stop:491 length:207 start_codon:yes stop_codon:yes gene_type:complete
MLDLDRRGVPGAMIATTAFEQAYEAQSKVLGFSPGIIYLPHPIQNRTDDEVRQLADEFVETVLDSITA